MRELLVLLFMLVGAGVIFFAIISPFLALFYQGRREKFFKKLASQYNLQFTKQDIPGYKTWFSSPHRAARIMEGKLNGKDVSVGDYVGSFYQWGNNLNFMTGWMRTEFFINGKAQIIPLSPYWGLASEKQIISFLDSIR